MGWEVIPWYTLTDDFDKDFGVDEWHGTNAFLREAGYADQAHLIREFRQFTGAAPTEFLARTRPAR